MKNLLLLCLGLLLTPAFAHRSSDAFLRIDATSATPSGELELAVRDVDRLISLDHNADDNITWQELQLNTPTLIDVLKQAVIIRQENTICAIAWQGQEPIQRQQDYYAKLTFQVSCPQKNAAMILDYRLFEHRDSSHRVLLQTLPGNTVQVLAPAQSFKLGDDTLSTMIIRFIAEGVHHIWIGIDHLLFLFCLLLPAALYQQRGQWQAREDTRAVLLDMFKLVTGFTVAHSITLVLAVYQLVSLPVKWVESAIALSVLLAALNLIWPVITGKYWRITFLFGLIHGFGFAAVVTALTLPTHTKAAALLSFNLGVELGQLAVVMIALPFLLLLRRMNWYRAVVLPLAAGSVAIMAGIWLIERAGDVAA